VLGAGFACVLVIDRYKQESRVLLEPRCQSVGDWRCIILGSWDKEQPHLDSPGSKSVSAYILVAG
jgi:hypothetical protein